jgi:hypothetical protein
VVHHPQEFEKISGIRSLTNYQGRDSALSPSPGASARRARARRGRSGDGKTERLPRSFRPAGRGRRSAASLPPEKFVIWIIPKNSKKTVDSLKPGIFCNYAAGGLQTPCKETAEECHESHNLFNKLLFNMMSIFQ